MMPKNHRVKPALSTTEPYGLLRVLREEAPDAASKRRVLVRCECGTERVMLDTMVRNGYAKSCGCARIGAVKAALTTHGGRESSEYAALMGARQRCSDPKYKGWHRYGGRGITVCDEWSVRGGFAAFLAHIGPRPSKDHSLDRWPNPDGNYEPGNVRWATREEQAANKICPACKGSDLDARGRCAWCRARTQRRESGVGRARA